MPRIPIVTPETAPEAARPLLAELRERSLREGKLLNVHAQMAQAPAILAAYLGVRRALEQFGTFDFRTRAAIMLTVSATDAAEYAEAVNVVLTRRSGFTPVQVRAIRAGAFDDDPKLAALLRVVRLATLNVGQVDDDAWHAAIAAGWTVTELNEAFGSIALTLLVDYFVHYAETPFDVPTPEEAAAQQKARAPEPSRA